MSDLKQAAQQALEALEEPHPGIRTSFTDAITYREKVKQAITALRTALEQQAEPVSHAVIAGALFDFMGWLTTRKERLVLSSTDNASPAVESITEFAKMRGLSLDDAKVQDWNTLLPQQQAEPVAWMDREGDLYKMPEIKNWAPPHTMLYTTPPQRPWVGLTDEEATKIWESTDDKDSWELLKRVEAKLKERNT